MVVVFNPDELACEQCYRTDEAGDIERICAPYVEAHVRVTTNARTEETVREEIPESGCRHECHLSEVGLARIQQEAQDGS